MSSDSSSDESSATPSLEIPGLSSADESLVPSPTGILSPSLSHASSIASLNGKPNIKFAPLPELGPRKRRSSAPLGVAARSQMVLRRRQQQGIPMNTYHSNPMWTQEELEQQEELAMREGQRRHNQHHLMDDGEEEEEDPLIVFGRLMKVAGKTIWRKVSIKDLSKKYRKDKDGKEAEEKDSGVSEEDKGDKHETGTDGASTLKEEQRPAITPADKGKHDDSFRTIGQTETIREEDAVWISGDGHTTQG